jgi:fructoselysine-6-P-deglycase FrlB-like protein
MDQSWCHTVGYLVPLVAAVAVSGHLSGLPVPADRVTALLDTSPTLVAAAGAVAAPVAVARRLVVIASGSDRTAGRELVLKVEEAAWIPSAFRDLETFLHGHLPATDDSTALVLVLAERDAREARVGRARQALAAARAVGVQAAAIVAESADEELDPSLTPAGRIVVPEAPDLTAPVAALLSTLVPLQVLTERIARARGTNPDPIRRDDARYREAAAAAE